MNEMAGQSLGQGVLDAVNVLEDAVDVLEVNTFLLVLENKEQLRTSLLL